MSNRYQNSSMTDIPLARDNASAEKHVAALENLINRYQSVNEPVNYKETAIGGIGNAAASSALCYWADIGLVNKIQSGVYTPTDEIVQYWLDDFQSSGESAQNVIAILNNYEPYKEAQYVLGRNEYDDIRELAGDVISIEESLSEDDLGDLVRSLETIQILNLLRTSDDATIDQGVSKSQNKEDSAGLKLDSKGEINYSSSTFGAEDLPRYASPEYLMSILNVMESGGSWTSDEIEDENDIELDKRNINGTLDYGVGLGFIEKSDEGYNPSSKGFELYYSRDNNEKVADILKESVRDFEPYVAILEAVFSKLGDFKDEETIKNEDIINILRTEFEYTEVSIDTLKRSVNTIFETLMVWAMENGSQDLVYQQG